MTEEFTARVEKLYSEGLLSGGTIHIEEIQDQVELALMRAESMRLLGHMFFIERNEQERREKSEENSQADELLE